jgi:hypothetical protein
MGLWTSNSRGLTVTGRMRNEETENWQTIRIGDRLASRSATRGTGGHLGPAGGFASPSQPGTSPAPGRSAFGCPGWPGKARCWFRGGRQRRIAVHVKCTSIWGGGWPPGSGPRARACSAPGKSHPSASRCRWSTERMRPWSVVAVAGKIEKDGAVRVWLAEVAGVCPLVRHRRGSPLWSSSGLGTFASPLELLVQAEGRVAGLWAGSRPAPHAVLLS